MTNSKAEVASRQGCEVHVMISGAFAAAYTELLPVFEQKTGIKVVTVRGPSMGTTEDAIPVRLKNGEKADVLIMAGDALPALIEAGEVAKDSRVDLVRSPIGAAVRAGAPRPDISTPEALRDTLLAAKSVAYSDSASGVYVHTKLFKLLGIEDQMKGKARMIPETPVGIIVAKGEAEFGMQQVSELMPIPGIDLLGPLPVAVDKFSIFSAALTSNATSPEGGAALIDFLSSPEAAPVIKRDGLEPITRHKG